MNRTYCLLIQVKSAQKIKVGKLGVFEFPRGYYVYIGSALNNLEARIARHFSKRKKKHWHIDYLLEKGKIIAFFASQKKECELNSEIFKIPGAMTPVEKFGSTDCGCKSHLAYFKENPVKYLVSNL
ncbi:MAG: GIY-YIG nuclease family protein [Candidatus Hydrothermarchaeota archaeon]|nr:GIY-YIG nuclease family protein [Candidatus Hydrothermarchaeota archaeon]